MKSCDNGLANATCCTDDGAAAISIAGEMSQTDRPPRARLAIQEAATAGSSFSTSETEDTLTVVFSGERRVHDFEKLEQQWEFWPQATALCRRKGIRRVLVVNELVGEISSTYVRGLHLNLEEFGLDRSLRYAMVVAEPRARGVLTFGIELAKGLGWDIEIFEETAAAAAWLARPLS